MFKNVLNIFFHYNQYHYYNYIIITIIIGQKNLSTFD